MHPNLQSWVALNPQNPLDHARTIVPDNRGMAYGDGFFSTMSIINGEILWQAYHQQRLISHAKALQLNIHAQRIMCTLQTYAKQLQQGMMKIIVTRAPQPLRGYGFVPNKAGSICEVWLKISPMPMDTTPSIALSNKRLVLLQPVMQAVCLQSQLACLPLPLAGLKSLNRLDNVLASGELHVLKADNPNQYQNCGEGLVRDMSGNWVEGTMSNVFYQRTDEKAASAPFSTAFSCAPDEDYLRQGQWFTPPLTHSGVAGVLRQVIIDALAQTDTPVIIRALTDDDLPQLKRLFFCNAVRGIMPVTVLTLLSGDRVHLSASLFSNL